MLLKKWKVDQQYHCTRFCAFKNGGNAYCAIVKGVLYPLDPNCVTCANQSSVWSSYKVRDNCFGYILTEPDVRFVLDLASLELKYASSVCSKISV